MPKAFLASPPGCSARFAGPLPSLRDWHRTSMLHRMATSPCICQEVDGPSVRLKLSSLSGKSNRCQSTMMAVRSSISGQLPIEVLDVSKSFGDKQVRSLPNCLGVLPYVSLDTGSIDTCPEAFTLRTCLKMALAWPC